ncbi:hypothetical protein [Sinosporangium siamense]|uniref:hypothetical protein n=1 Tax=Sinosporangium siamense TaxID=1367973 RepID=UPI00194E257A|nr:hypothetical protein [Sinosporangium siamense]
MLDETVARYDDLLDRLGIDTFVYTVTLPDAGVLTVERAAHRLGFAPGALQDSERPYGGNFLTLYQAGSGIVTLDWSHPYSDRKQVTDRLTGDGIRHWYLSFDIEGNTSMFVCYGQVEGYLESPEPVSIPFTGWREHLGPLGAYADLFASAYDDDEAEAEVDVNAACLAVIETESGIRLDDRLLNSRCSVLPLPGRAKL